MPSTLPRAIKIEFSLVRFPLEICPQLRLGLSKGVFTWKYTKYKELKKAKFSIVKLFSAVPRAIKNVFLNGILLNIKILES